MMNSIELKIPPPIVFLIFSGIMWAISQAIPDVAISLEMKKIGFFLIILIAVATGAAGVYAFRKANTTVNPHRPDLSSSLVTSGIYRYTRNPMYLALALLLIAWAIYLSNVVSLLCVPGFIFYITRFQIIPEESKLTELFGQAFLDYQRQVRRWI